MKFESPMAHEMRLLNDPVAKKEWEEYTKKKKRENDKHIIISVLYHNPELLQEALGELRRMKINNLI